MERLGALLDKVYLDYYNQNTVKKFVLVIVAILLILPGLGGCQCSAPGDEGMKQNVIMVRREKWRK